MVYFDMLYAITEGPRWESVIDEIDASTGLTWADGQLPQSSAARDRGSTRCVITEWSFLVSTYTVLWHDREQWSCL